MKMQNTRAELITGLYVVLMTNVYHVYYSDNSQRQHIYYI